MTQLGWMLFAGAGAWLALIGVLMVSLRLGEVWVLLAARRRGGKES